MTARSRQRVFFALLALALGARAIIPVGYMPGSLLAGEFMVLCPSGGGALFVAHSQDRGNAGHAAHHGQAPGAHAGDIGHVAGADDVCPIGSVLFAGMLPAAIEFAASVRPGAYRIAGRAGTVYLPRPVRPFSPRAPPAAI